MTDKRSLSNRWIRVGEVKFPGFAGQVLRDVSAFPSSIRRQSTSIGPQDAANECSRKRHALARPKTCGGE